MKTADWRAVRADGVTTVSFPQPGPLMNMNHRSNWRQRWKSTKQWRTAACQAGLLLGPPSTRSHGPSWVTVDVPVPDRRRRDPANLTPIVKACVDGLVDAGYWPDDTPEWVTTLEPRLVVDQERSMVRIRIADRAAGLPTERLL